MAYREYSAFAIGFVMTWITYLLLPLFGFTNVRLPQWLWYYGILYLVIGIFVEFGTRRVLWIRIYQLIGAASIALVASLLLWALLTEGRSLDEMLVTGMMLLFIVIGSMVVSRYRTISQMGELAYGFTGRLDTQTGLIDPAQAPASRRGEVEQARQTASFWLRLTPLFAGLAMFLANTLSETGLKQLILIAVAFMLLMGAMGIGRIYHYLHSIYRLEREYHKPLYLKIRDI